MIREPEFGRVFAPIAFLVVLIAGCGGQEGTEASTSSIRISETIRQTDSNGERLPFETVHSRRWNSANDGTEFEPCTALAPSVLIKMGVDVESVRDAAGTNGQTLRGCKWHFLKGPSDVITPWRIAQFVGNSESLEVDKARKSADFDIWEPDVIIQGRVVGVHRTRSGDNCDTYVQSGRAAVSTLVTYSGRNQPPPTEICERALEFTRATIGKMPL